MATGTVEEILRATLVKNSKGWGSRHPERSEGSPVVFSVSPETSRRSLLASLVRDDTTVNQSQCFFG